MALGRHALFGTAVAAAFGLPYAFSDKDESARPAAAAPDTAATAAVEETTKQFPALQDTSRPLEGPAVADLGEVLHFEVTPAWLTSRWPRVMNTRHQAGALQAYRVPLVTGPKETDLAGSLTYYFDADQRLERIEFSGRTGDARVLVEFLSQRHNFVRRRSADPGTIEYEVRRDGKPISELVLRSAPVLDASLPQSWFHVQLALSRTSEHRMFSEAPAFRFDSRHWP
jgi:hypothetical protein